MCAFDGCSKPVVARALCSGHYQQSKRGPLKPLNYGPPIEERFWEKVNKTSDCWIWTGWLCNGYGYFRIGPGRKMTVAHRYAWEQLVGRIPDGMFLDHDGPNGCHNRRCVRPEHLTVATPLESVLSRPSIDRNRTCSRRGCDQKFYAKEMCKYHYNQNGGYGYNNERS